MFVLPFKNVIATRQGNIRINQTRMKVSKELLGKWEEWMAKHSDFVLEPPIKRVNLKTLSYGEKTLTPIHITDIAPFGEVYRQGEFFKQEFLMNSSPFGFIVDLVWSANTEPKL